MLILLHFWNCYANKIYGKYWLVAWLHSVANLLNQFKSILKDNEYELFDSHSLARLKQCLVKYYNSEICFDEEQEKNI